MPELELFVKYYFMLDYLQSSVANIKNVARSNGYDLAIIKTLVNNFKYKKSTTDATTFNTPNT